LYVRMNGAAEKAGPMAHPVSDPLGALTAAGHVGVLTGDDDPGLQPSGGATPPNPNRCDASNVRRDLSVVASGARRPFRLAAPRADTVGVPSRSVRFTPLDLERLGKLKAQLGDISGRDGLSRALAHTLSMAERDQPLYTQVPSEAAARARDAAERVRRDGADAADADDLADGP
jgi:hypothetical protein